ncbi:hypothetical protein HNQ94_002713 [Salirhabdus euzebyi]|uniref:Uncharacterized protein n=1 Tax=Salirhabdus euzebyi TaxID=394506 RepID=A0A841Q757_9BACI|nr:YqhR family membrane protein [Salirhabdus euzebyi]MBB6454238.1 hypothetical protein [Salirhabdus euzebyi]
MENNQTEPKLEQNQHKKPMSLFHKAILTGFVGGVFWSGLASLAYYFNFMEVSHASFILRSFFNGTWTQGLLGEVISMVIVGVLSIGTALVYYLFFKKRGGMLPGILFGSVLWIAFMYFLNPMFEAVPLFSDLKMDTVITSICLYVLYGTFIGYSISYEYENIQLASSNKGKSSQNAG